MNTFRRGDTVNYKGNRREVAFKNGPYVYFKEVDGCARYGYYSDCSLFSAADTFESQPKFKPGDVVSNGNPGNKDTIKCVKTLYPDGEPYRGPLAYDYVSGNGGWDYQTSLTVVESAPDILELICAGKKIEAIKQHRIINGSGLKEAKDAIEALAVDCATLGDILSSVVSAPKFKVGDRVKHRYSEDIVYTVSYVRDNGWLLLDGYSCANDPSFFSLVASSPSIVIRINAGGALIPSTIPHKHETRELAEAEARRLAVANPGVDFAVFSLQSTSRAPKPVTPVAVTVPA